jgi:hypothetical protein
MARSKTIIGLTGSASTDQDLPLDIYIRSRSNLASSKASSLALATGVHRL